MAMKMDGQVTLAASQQRVWEKLNDPAVLQACIPGCQSLERSGENGYSAVAKVKIGPISASFKGNVELSDLDPPRFYRITGSGEGGIAGFAKGHALVSLEQAGEGCLLTYQVESTVGGKMAQLGSRLIDGVAKKMADEFFARFANAVDEAKAGAV